ncbi:hypothetical protein F8M41_011665 [Gigaspora margarita]|uniref:Myb-like DNA-binding domain containing protein n=1 Tax=Gigaspora margarita TaxID=4874 RepID=A0A8H4EPT2_GIGMA|nr:hypothetical protein F8M41_011665 [Gigaspora margarita]
MTERTPKVSWTPEEDANLMKLIKEHGTSWAIIASRFVHRDAKSCKNRHQYLKRRSIEWTDEEDSKLRQAVEDNRKAFNEYWKLIAEKIPNKTWQQCEKRWNSIPKLKK